MTEKEQRGRQHVAAWRASGLSQREYCDHHNLSRSALGYWSWKVNAEKKDGEFVEVHSTGRGRAGGSGTSIELFVGPGYRVRLGEGFSTEALKHLLDVIEAR